MTEITASAVKALRDRTGAGMMDCKEALQEADGDEERAIEILRKKGAATAARRADRATTEGCVAIAGEDPASPMAMVEVTSETDFVAKNEEFVAFAERAAETALASDLPEGEVVEGEELLDHPDDRPLRQELNELRAKIGENLRLERFVRYEPGDGSVVGRYIHFGSKIGVMLELSGADEAEGAADLARELAMHVAASGPLAVAPEDIPEEEREKERKFLEEQAEEEGKPPHIVEQIVEGRMRKFYEQNALLKQGFVKDPDVPVEEMLEEESPAPEVRRFVRFEIGS